MGQCRPPAEHEFRKAFTYGDKEVAEDVIILYVGRIEAKPPCARPNLSMINHDLPISSSSSMSALMMSSQRLFRVPARRRLVISSST